MIIVFGFLLAELGLLWLAIREDQKEKRRQLYRQALERWLA